MCRNMDFISWYGLCGVPLRQIPIHERGHRPLPLKYPEAQVSRMDGE